MTSARPRILHVHIALYQPALLVRGLRELGYRADCVMVDGGKAGGWLSHLDVWDYDLRWDRTNVPSSLVRLGAFLAGALHRYDVFHFHSLPTFLPIRPTRFPAYLGLDARLLRAAGKRLVVSRWGCRDGRLRSNYVNTTPYRSCVPCQVGTFHRTCSDAWTRALGELARRWFDLVLVNEPDFEDYNEGAVFLDGAVDTEAWRPDLALPERLRLPAAPPGTVRVFHSVGNSVLRGDFKGTSFVLAAVERLRAEGHRLELLSFDRVPNRDLKFYQLQADVVVDQLYYGHYGSMAREAMALGKPVIGFVRQDFRTRLPGLPIVDARLDTVADRLRELVVSPERRAELGRQGRAFAVRQHGVRAVAGRLAALYEALWNGRELPEPRGRPDVRRFFADEAVAHGQAPSPSRNDALPSG